MPSNMKTVIDEPIATDLARNGHFYVMHRFDLDTLAFARRMREQGLIVSISAGVKAHDFETIDRLAAGGVGADYIPIDIARRIDHDHVETGPAPSPTAWRDHWVSTTKIGFDQRIASFLAPAAEPKAFLV